MKEKLTSEELIERFLNGDESCFGPIIVRYKHTVLTYIKRTVHDKSQAEDILSDTFVNVFQLVNQGKYPKETNFISWVLQIAKYVMNDKLRKYGKEVEDLEYSSDIDLLESDLYSNKKPVKDPKEKKVSKDLKELINQLPEEMRQVVFLRYFKGMSFKTIAKIYDIPLRKAIYEMENAMKYIELTEDKCIRSIFDDSIIDLTITDDISSKDIAYFMHLLSELYFAKIGKRLTINDAFILQKESFSLPVEL